MRNLFFCHSILVCTFFSPQLHADAYRYNPVGKVDPFQSLAAAATAVFGTSGRLQKYELSELSLVGTAIGKDSTALVVTPSPIEGFLVRVGDSVGKRGGKIVSLTKQEMIVREFGTGAVGAKLKSALIVMSLSSKVVDLKDRASATIPANGDILNFDSLSGDQAHEKSGLAPHSSDKTTPDPVTLAPVTTPVPAVLPTSAPKLLDIPTTPFKGITP